MMHGMTGDASMMRPFAEKILPEGWTLLVPEARYKHPNRGYTWWRYEDFDADVTRRMSLSRKELMDVDSSLSQLEKLIAEEAPMGPLIVGGFLKAAPWHKSCFNSRLPTASKGWCAWRLVSFVPWNCVCG